jgi:hypothetical protein
LTRKRCSLRLGHGNAKSDGYETNTSISQIAGASRHHAAVPVLRQVVAEEPSAVPSLPRNASRDPRCSGRPGRQAQPNPSRIALHAPRCGDSLFCWRLQRDGPASSDRSGCSGLSNTVAVLGRPGLNSLRVLFADQGVIDFPVPQNFGPDSAPIVPHSLSLLPNS